MKQKIFAVYGLFGKALEGGEREVKEFFYTAQTMEDAIRQAREDHPEADIDSEGIEMRS